MGPGDGVGVGVGGFAALTEAVGDPKATIKSTIKANSDTSLLNILPPSQKNRFTFWNHYCTFPHQSQQVVLVSTQLINLMNLLVETQQLECDASSFPDSANKVDSVPWRISTSERIHLRGRHGLLRESFAH